MSGWCATNDLAQCVIERGDLGTCCTSPVYGSAASRAEVVGASGFEAWPLGDGAPVGVTHILGDPDEDIFDGVGFRHHLWTLPRMAPAAMVARITARAVHLNFSAGDAGHNGRGFRGLGFIKLTAENGDSDAQTDLKIILILARKGL